LSARAGAKGLAAAFAAASHGLAMKDVDTVQAALRAADIALADEPDDFDAANRELVRARTYRLAGDRSRTRATLAKALEFARRLPADDGVRLVVQALCDMGDLDRDDGRLESARSALEEAVGLARERLGPNDPDTASAWNSLGMWYRYHGDLPAAASAYRSARSAHELTKDVCGQATVLHNIASLEQLNGRAVDAEATIRRALAPRPLGDPGAAADLGVLAVVMTELGSYEEAARIYGQVRVLLGTGADPRELAYLDANEAALAHRHGDFDLAKRQYAAALSATESAFGTEHHLVGVVAANAASLAADIGDTFWATALAGEAVDVLNGASEQLPSLRLAREILDDLQRSLSSSELHRPAS
jgi:tetratricopeptide (TPR) repeat protein